MPTQPHALILSGDGINCEQETLLAFSQAGFDTTLTHIQDLATQPEHLARFQVLALPGGFSFGDEISSGQLLAIKLRYVLSDHFRTAVDEGLLVVGICNGFQALVKLGLLPDSQWSAAQQVTLTHNRQRQFINQWVTVRPSAQVSLFWDEHQQPTPFMLPLRHGEGRLVLAPDFPTEKVIDASILTYETDINGSAMNIAGLCNPAQTVIGLMPHPEAFIRWTQHPGWTSMPQAILDSSEPRGLTFFKNLRKRFG